MSIAGECAHEGAHRIVVIGGNGTVREVADGLLNSSNRRAGVELAHVPIGIGMDFARSLKLPLNPAAALERAAQGMAQPVDVGRIAYVGEDAIARVNHFVNVASLGVSGPIVQRVNAGKRLRFVPGGPLFFLQSIRAILGYRFQKVAVQVDDRPPLEADVAVVAVAIGKFFGSGMAIAPDALVDDGVFDIVILRGRSRYYLVDQMNRIYNGGHRNLPDVTILRGKRLSVEPLMENDRAILEIDGDSPGRIPATFEILPKALNVVR